MELIRTLFPKNDLNSSVLLDATDKSSSYLAVLNGEHKYHFQSFSENFANAKTTYFNLIEEILENHKDKANELFGISLEAKGLAQALSFFHDAFQNIVEVSGNTAGTTVGEDKSWEHDSAE
jgi:hypothetical protein